MKTSSKKEEEVVIYPRYAGSYCHKKDAYLTMEVKTDGNIRTLTFPGIQTQTDIILENDREGLEEKMFDFLVENGIYERKRGDGKTN